MDRWPERLDGRAVRSVDAHGKHLFLRFEGDLTLHSHLRMGGAWAVYRRGQRWRRSPRRAWLVIRTPEHEVVQFDGPVLELMTDSRTRFDQRLANLGPDVLASTFDERAFLRRLREDDQSRGIADALLDQRNLAGIGNLWKAEALLPRRGEPVAAARARCRTSSPSRSSAGIRPLMQASAEGGFQQRDPWVFERHGRPCRRCGTLDRGPRPGRRQPHHLLVPQLPGMIRVGHKGADHVAPGNTVESFQAALEHGVDMIEFDILRTRDGRLILAHDYEDAPRPDALTLEEGLDHLAGSAYAHLQLDVDLKLPGYEREVVEGLVERGLADRSLVSTMYLESLDRLGELGPGYAAAGRCRA